MDNEGLPTPHKILLFCKIVYFIVIMTMCFDKIVMTSLWNMLWAQNLDIICKRDRYFKLLQSFRFVRLSVSLLLAKKHKKCGKNESPWGPIGLTLRASGGKMYSLPSHQNYRLSSKTLSKTLAKMFLTKMSSSYVRKMLVKCLSWDS